ncbi:zinc finger protein 26-like [Plodia interpunctella]|uniref:zinc finger protein 26-like n=1 Tax=Plodia interpunctella TaxID=58824 RepID=UPI002368E501|nr:zinc finger protein 26-like [Plodia interpunctella]XP_053620869.1 zinc finger protein 26-like [Plodia interpunctella]XP_053620870.1 zinc finger protein 26-like [Plodia interpunctella]
MSENEDVKAKLENDIQIKDERKDPTCFLPDEPMSYEIKKKKKKKKKKKNKERDPFRDLDVQNDELTLEMQMDPEVNIKVENIEVELDFNDFANNTGLMVEGPQSEDSQEPEIKIEEQNHEAVLLTFESVVNKTLLEYSENIKYDEEGNVIGFEQPGASVLGYPQNIPMKTAPTHMCKVCHLVFQSHKTLKMHQKRKHKAYRKYFEHICDYCGMSYEQKNSLVAHMRRKHGPDSTPDDREERTCEVCALVFKGNTRLRMHMRRKHGSFQDSFKFSCEECGLTYDKHSSLVVHQRRKHSGITQPVLNQWFNCPFCPKVFTRRETYARHVQRKHRILDEDEIKEEFLNVKNEETGEITCKQCPLVFSSVNFLKLHMRRKHNALTEDFRLKCRICNLSYDKIESLKRHVRRKHGENSHCEVCNRQFDSREAYLNHSHVKTHSECSICGLIFASEGNLGKHMRLTHKIDSPKHVFCSSCNEGFYDKRQLKSHLMKVHLKVTYTCMFCSKVFKAKESYRRHILFKHPESNDMKNQAQNCEQCSASFPNEFELCRHINSEHCNEQDKEVKEEIVVVKQEDGIKESFQCTKCPESYTAWEQLRLHHEQNHHLPEETQCQVCGEMVPGNALKKHMRNIHIEEPQCKYCEFKTNNRASMTQHILRHKNITTLHCDYMGCRYKTYYEGAMQRHKRKHVEIGVKLQCSKCPFQTMNKYILRYHEEAHTTGKKRYVCDQCDYATILPANLVQHKYKHSEEKRFKCEVCPFATKYNTSLRFHVKKKHCDLPSLS